MSENKDFSSIPATACMMNVGEFALGDNGENAKTAPLSMVARSGQPIEHWFWGRVVHDLSGMKLHKKRLTVDYVHDDKEIIGYLNKFSSDTGDLVASGALVPFKDSDRATEIIHKMKAGVPYEASINFGGDGIKLEDVPEGFTTKVNGYEFEGPGVIVREWPLRGVAICPYGADSNTESNTTFNSSKTFSAHVVPTKQEPTQEDEMSQEEDKKSVEDVASYNTPDNTTEMTEDTAEATAEAVTDDVSAVEAGTVEAEAETETLTNEPSDEPTEQDKTRSEFSRMRTEFGDAIAAEIFEAGGDYTDALKLAFEKSQDEINALKITLSETGAGATGKPVKVTEHKTPKKLFNTGK